jgi:hypothetical protein
MSVGDWIKLVLYGNTLAHQLWYLTALMQALIVFHLCTKYRLLLRNLPFIVLIGIALFLIVNEVQLLNLSYYYYRNFFTFAVPFMYIGMVIRLNEHRICTLTKPIIMALIAGFLLLYAEYAMLRKPYMCELSVMVILVSIFVFVLALKSKVRNSLVANIGRNHSSNIYVYHTFVLMLFDTNKFHAICYSSTGVFEVFFATMLFSSFLRQYRRVFARITDMITEKNN